MVIIGRQVRVNQRDLRRIGAAKCHAAAYSIMQNEPNFAVFEAKNAGRSIKRSQTKPIAGETRRIRFAWPVGSCILSSFESRMELYGNRR